jgi:alpha-glucosidase
VYLYQGEELGLEQVDDIPEEMLADPVWRRSGQTRRGRDGCRVPLPWSRSGPSFGFGSGEPWLPQPAHWSKLSVEAEDADRVSMLWLYRDALHIRRDLAALHTADHAWIDLGEDVLAFTRGSGFACVVNFGMQPIELPRGEVLLTSLPVDADGRMSTDAAAWIRLR